VPLQRYRAVAQLAEAALLLISLLIAVQFTFGGRVEQTSLHPLFAIIPFPFLILAAIRFGPVGAAPSTFLTVCIAVRATVLGYGPFDMGTLEYRLAYLYAFMALAAVTSLFVAAVFTERQRGELLLQEREERFRALVEKSSEPVLLVAPDGTI